MLPVFDEGVLPVHVRLDVVRMPRGQPFLQRTVRLCFCQVSDHVRPKGHVPYGSIAAGEKSVNVVCSRSVPVILSEVPTTRNPKLPERLVAQTLHRRYLLIQSLYALHFEQDVDDRLGHNARNRGAANVVHPDDRLTKRLNDADRLAVERVLPIRIVRNDSHLH